jgi:hypothetical protein
MRCLLVALIFISLWALFSELRAESSTACPVTTQVESTAIARAWHDDVINRRNPTKLSDIVGPEVVHHAAGGYQDHERGRHRGHDGRLPRRLS